MITRHQHKCDEKHRLVEVLVVLQTTYLKSRRQSKDIELPPVDSQHGMYVKK